MGHILHAGGREDAGGGVGGRGEGTREECDEERWGEAGKDLEDDEDEHCKDTRARNNIV